MSSKSGQSPVDRKAVMGEPADNGGKDLWNTFFKPEVKD